MLGCATFLSRLDGSTHCTATRPVVTRIGLVQVKVWEEEHKGAMDERAKRCTALDAERKSLAASIEDAAASFDEGLASLIQVRIRPQQVAAIVVSCCHTCYCRSVRTCTSQTVCRRHNVLPLLACRVLSPFCICSGWCKCKLIRKNDTVTDTSLTMLSSL